MAIVLFVLSNSPIFKYDIACIIANIVFANII